MIETNGFCVFLSVIVLTRAQIREENEPYILPISYVLFSLTIEIQRTKYYGI